MCNILHSIFIANFANRYFYANYSENKFILQNIRIYHVICYIFANMKIDTNKLMSVSKYANAHGKSLAWAYKQIKEKKVEFVTLDGTKFIVVNK